MKFDLNRDMASWIKVLNNNLKWSIALIIRVTMTLLLFVLLISILKWTGVIKSLKNFVNELNDISVQPEKPVKISQPSTPTHSKELKRSRELRNLIKERIKKSQEDK